MNIFSRTTHKYHENHCGLIVPVIVIAFAGPAVHTGTHAHIRMPNTQTHARTLSIRRRVVESAEHGRRMCQPSPVFSRWRWLPHAHSYGNVVKIRRGLYFYQRLSILPAHFPFLKMLGNPTTTISCVDLTHSLLFYINKYRVIIFLCESRLDVEKCE